MVDTYKVSRRMAKKEGVPAVKVIGKRRYIFWSGGWSSHDVAEAARKQAKDNYGWIARIIVIKGKYYLYARHGKG